MTKQVELYQLTPDKNVLMNCYVIRTKNDKIIVVDGGYYGAEYCYFIHSAIRAILGLKENDYFEIEAWLLSHCHEDHFGEMGLQFERYSKDSNFKVNNIYFDFADFESMHYKDVGDVIYQFRDRFIRALDNYANVNGICVKEKSFYAQLNGAVINANAIRDGLKINVDGIEFEFLQTWDKSDNIVNSSSFVAKMKVYEDGALAQTVMFLGDTSLEGGERLLKTVPKEKLKSDIVQMAHHGNWACDKSVYDAIGAKVHLWPTPLWVWNCINERFDINKVREWVGTTGADNNNIISCLYDAYPDNRESVEDWKKVIDGMKLTLPYNV